MSYAGYLFAAFALTWAAAFVYLWLLSRRASLLERQLEALRHRLAARGED